MLVMTMYPPTLSAAGARITVRYNINGYRLAVETDQGDEVAGEDASCYGAVTEGAFELYELIESSQDAALESEQP